MVELSIVDFNKNISKILARVVKTGEEVAILKHKKPYVTIKSCKNNPIENKNIASLDKPKQEKLQELRQTIKSVEDKPVETPKETYYETHYCFACLKLNRRRKATEFVPVYEDGRVKEIWLCEVCKSRHSVCV